MAIERLLAIAAVCYALPVPDPQRRQMPWWTGLLLPALALTGVVGLFVLASTLQSAAFGLSAEDAAQNVQLDPLNLAAIQAVGFGAVLVLGVLWFRRGERLRDALRLRPVSTRLLLLTVLAGASLQFPLAELGNLMQEIFPVSIEEQLFRRRMLHVDGPLRGLSVILAVVAVAPVTEELLFRGFLLPGIAEGYGDRFALGLTSLSFGLVHQDPIAVVYAILAGLLLGTVALRTGSTVPAITLHASINAVPVLLPEQLVSIPGLNTVSEGVYHLPLPLLVGAILVSAAAFVGLFRLADMEPRP